MFNYQLIAHNFEEELYDSDDSSADYSRFPVIAFKILQNGNVIFSFLPEQGASAEKWDKMADATVDGNYCIDWSPSNGSCDITVRDDEVEFEVAKYGDGRGGSLLVTLPKNICTAAFRDAAKMTREWYAERMQQ